MVARAAPTSRRPTVSQSGCHGRPASRREDPLALLAQLALRPDVPVETVRSRSDPYRGRWVVPACDNEAAEGDNENHAFLRVCWVGTSLASLTAVHGSRWPWAAPREREETRHGTHEHHRRTDRGHDADHAERRRRVVHAAAGRGRGPAPPGATPGGNRDPPASKRRAGARPWPAWKAYGRPAPSR